jgi:hypothetical protein
MGLLMSEELQESAEVENIEVQAGESEQPQESTQSERPDWLPEKFERPEELANSYKELERSFYKRRDEFRNEIMEEINKEAANHAPTSPADYEINVEAPEGLEYQINEEDPMLDWFKQTAHNYGLSQDEFNGLMSEYVQMDAMRGPDWNVESEHLGEYAEKRLERVDGWAHKNLSEEAYNVFANVPASAGMVQLFEELMELNGQPQFNMVSESEFQEQISIDDLRTMQNDPRYWKEKDPAFIARVRAGFDQHARRNG